MLKIDVAYGEYFDKFSGGRKDALSKEDFDRYIKKAKLFLESLIQGSVDEENSDKIKDCLFALAEEFSLEDKTGFVRSENIDGYSVTYLEKDSIEQRLLKIACLYLGKSGLLYAGVE